MPRTARTKWKDWVPENRWLSKDEKPYLEIVRMAPPPQSWFSALSGSGKTEAVEEDS